jgi:hypothetical protein
LQVLSVDMCYVKKLLGLSLQENYTDRATPLVDKVSANSADRVCHVVSVTDPYGRIMSYLDRSRYFFFQVAP